MKKENNLLLPQCHNDILVIAKKMINRRKITLSLVLFMNLFGGLCNYISKGDVVIIYICYIVIIALYNPFEKVIFIAEDICFKKRLHKLNSILGNAKKAVHIKNFIIITFIQLGICSDMYKHESKYPVIILFVVYVIIDFIYNPMKKVLEIIEEHVNVEINS